jgi:hypothetical protein
MIAPENDIYQDDWTQRLKENPSDPLEDIRQEHEGFLSELEGLAVEAIATNDWTTFYAHVVDFQNEHDLHGESVIAVEEVSADELDTPSAGSLPTTEQ